MLTLPLKKTIYNTSGFAKFFDKRNELIIDIFVKSIEMIISHEVAHIANGHFLLQAKDPEFVNQKEIKICMEQNADDTAIRWLIADVLFETIDGNSASPVLAYTKKELIKEWVLTTFSAYLSISWIYRDKEREWNSDTLDAYVENDTLSHPIYQFRTYNIVNRAINLIPELIKINDEKYVREHGLMTTSDKIVLCNEMVNQAIDQIVDMLNSFEHSFFSTYNDKRSEKEIVEESWRVEKYSVPDSVQKIPFLMPVFYEDARMENEKIKELWPNIREKLKEAGAYSNLFSTV